MLNIIFYRILDLVLIIFNTWVIFFRLILNNIKFLSLVVIIFVGNHCFNGIRVETNFWIFFKTYSYLGTFIRFMNKCFKIILTFWIIWLQWIASLFSFFNFFRIIEIFKLFWRYISVFFLAFNLIWITRIRLLFFNSFNWKSILLFLFYRCFWYALIIFYYMFYCIICYLILYF